MRNLVLFPWECKLSPFNLKQVYFSYPIGR